MFHQTNDAEFFRTAQQLQEAGFKRDGPFWKKRKQVFLPLYEAKMTQMYDHRAASVVVDETNWMRQGQTDATTLVQHQNPEYAVEPRWWVDAAQVRQTVGKELPASFLSFKDITSPTNQRTMIATAIPWTGVTNHLPLILTESEPRRSLCLLANLNAFVLDYVARQKIGGVTLNFFIVEQLPVFAPDFYERRCVEQTRETREVDCGPGPEANLREPRHGASGGGGRVQALDPQMGPEQRAQLQAELDAAFFLLYGIRREDVEYVLSTFSGIRNESEGLLAGGTTMARILACYDKFWQAAASA